MKKKSAMIAATLITSCGMAVVGFALLSNHSNEQIPLNFVNSISSAADVLFDNENAANIPIGNDSSTDITIDNDSDIDIPFYNVNTSNQYDQQIGVMPDFVKNYDQITDLIADSEIIAYGNVENATSYITDYKSIYTKFTFQMDEVLKGNFEAEAPEIQVQIQGGIVSYAEYFNANKDMFEAKLSEEDFRQAKEDSISRGTELVQELFHNVANITNGDRILLFLAEEEKDTYYVVGSSYFGLFYLDNLAPTHTKQTEAGGTRKILDMDLAELKTAISNTPDKSQQIKAEKPNPKYQNTVIKNGEEIEKDSQFDIYKDDFSD